jgi:glycosyltransferase A (GT-A) superfamily protein (DUF2064 family)
MTTASPGAALTVLVVAKAPVSGQAKTRLAATVGDACAADLAAAALLDTLAACQAAVGASRCRLALAGDLAAAARSEDLHRALAGWSVVPQIAGSFGERLVAAHQALPGPVVQVGMDTPQLTAELLLDTASGLADHDAVLAPAEDGGWWALALRDGRRATPLGTVPMSRPTTYDDTRRALSAAGLSVGTAAMLRDVDRIDDVAPVVADAPDGRFARAARGLA